MPTLLTHPAIPISLAIGAGSASVSGRLLSLGILVAILPDLDVIAFKFGIAYANILGHRGLSHSLLFAFLLAFVFTAFSPWLRSSFKKTFFFLFITAISHTLLDALTNGGLGVALFWPWNETRYFAPMRPIQFSPFSLTRLFSAQGLNVFKTELYYVWLPCLGIASLFAFKRLIFRKRS